MNKNKIFINLTLTNQVESNKLFSRHRRNVKLPYPGEEMNFWDSNKYKRMNIPNVVDMKHHSGKATKNNGKPWVTCHEKYNPECCAPHIYVDCEGPICERHIGWVMRGFSRVFLHPILSFNWLLLTLTP